MSGRIAIALAMFAIAACDGDDDRARPPAPVEPPAAAKTCPDPKTPLGQRLGARVQEVAAACQRVDPLATDPAIDAKVAGRWKGEYGYEDGRSSVAIDVTFFVDAGSLTGSMNEPNTFGTHPYYSRFDSTLTGRVYASGQVVLMKTYTTGPSHSVLYSGRLLEEGSRIEGRWDTKDPLSGTFWLQRE